MIGPGLGRDPTLEKFLPKFLDLTEDKLVVADADFLHFLTQGIIEEDLIKKKSSTLILTPNKAEFSRLWEKFIGSISF